MTLNAGLTPTADATPMIAKIIGVFSVGRPQTQRPKFRQNNQLQQFFRQIFCVN